MLGLKLSGASGTRKHLRGTITLYFQPKSLCYTPPMDSLLRWASHNPLQPLRIFLRRIRDISPIRVARLSSMPPSKPGQPKQSQGSTEQHESIRDKRGRIIKYGRTGSVELNAYKLAKSLKMWAQPGYKDQVMARWARPEFRNQMIAKFRQGRWPPDQYDLRRVSLANKFILKRNDSDPKARERWDSRVSDANKFVAKLNSSHLSRYYRNAFAVLRLDASQFDTKLSLGKGRERMQPSRRITESQVTKLREEFYHSASKSGGPFSSREKRDKVRDALGIDHALLRDWINSEIRMWLRSAAVLELKGVKVDYANIPHLAWLA